MPPFVSRKRSVSASPGPTPPPAKRTKTTSTTKPKQSLFEAADAPLRKQKSTDGTRKLLDRLSKDHDDDDESSLSSSLSEVDSDEFEDVKPGRAGGSSATKPAAAHEDEDEDMDWEDAIPPPISHTLPHDVQEIADISISVNDDGSYVQPLVANSSNSNSKKGPSKRERQIRIQTHCLHVTTLLWHNVVRNSWLNDAEVHRGLLDGLPHGVKREITRWREAMGTLSKEELEEKKRQAAAKSKIKGRRKAKGKDVGSGRDWSYAAEHLEQGVPDLSRGDPLLRLLKVLTAYWRKRFVITAPSLRKQGYMTLTRLRNEMKDWEKDRTDAEVHGERIENVKAFRVLAKNCEGSRDVGAQLFVALLRAIGLETRMVVNLQPAGFGWSKAEDADERRPRQSAKVNSRPTDGNSSDGSEDEHRAQAAPKPVTKKEPKKQVKEEKPTRKSTRGNQKDPINLDDSDSALSSPPSDLDKTAISLDDEEDDDSIIDVTPVLPKRPSKKYDRELAFPTYWTEVCSPVSHKYIPVDPIVLSTIASNSDLLQTFEPRGKKADKTKQVMCYTVAFSADGTAKDVTVRYLKRHQLPGKTKGVRMPVEKIPVYDKRGKVKKYEDFDWFRTAISPFDRPDNKRTPADDLEEQTDLKPYAPAREEKEAEKESLQWYKQSAEFALEQHLRREEALVPGAESVKTFIAGKGDKAKEHPVYLRKDVVACKTVESWHKEGRAINVGEQPIKYVPVRAVTLIRKREIEDAQRETGEKPQQGLYSRSQTDWIIPPPIENGVIPKNAFGNMDVYVPTMVPKGAIHLPLRGTAKICRKLQIDYAEACTGFEFGKQRAVPVLTGVVVAKENARLVEDAWRAAQEEIKRKEDTKRTGVALHWWRKMLMGLRIVERMREEYAQSGGNEDEINPFVNKAKREGRGGEMDQTNDEDMEGGFLPPDHVSEAGSPSGGFLLEDDPEYGGGGGFLVDDESEPRDPPKGSAKNQAPITPMSLQAMHNENEEDPEGSTVEDKPIFTVPPSTRRKTPKSTKKATKPNQIKKKPAVKLATPSEDEDDESEQDESEISSASDLASDDDDASSVVKISTRRTQRSKESANVKPRVEAKPTPARRSGRSKQKSTPVKSQYFAHDEDDEDDEESATEVVQPRRTTARTKKKA